ncbi:MULTISPECIES: L,D-transpeptidase family protein [Inquilinus]|uniref:Murein L,D-transpeptidase YcbB/YkuD n=1 Tax=Inquilinus ginsengisoli TaxID=363840 RepID=A0ABU1JNQ0_9PROT|nr:L,D-transpeptidase family protein [Inquilinus ginsengisoli]MDR6290245.1 murein L,D-transpeptidase YcbB/YkuD [Inquilinus ginsengisoli]
MIRWALVLAVALAPHLAVAGTRPTPVPAEDHVHAVLRAALERAEAADRAPLSIPLGATLKPAAVDPRVPMLRERLDAVGITLPAPAMSMPAVPATPAASVVQISTSPAAIPAAESAQAGEAQPGATEAVATSEDLIGPVAPATLVYDEELTQRVKLFQSRWGLRDDGVVGRRTFRALNFTPADEAQALRQTLARYAPPPARGKSITVNVPTAEIIAFENGVEVMRTRAVVGSPLTQTPMIQTNMIAVKYNPDWTVPPGLTKKYKALMAAGKYDEMRKHGVVVKTPEGQTFDPAQVPPDAVGTMGWKFWQPPGDANALGLLKFELDNDQAIYLHDTNNRTLFATDNRAVSNGCIRVEDYLGLAAWVLGIDTIAVEREIALGTTHYARVNRIPVRMTYYMAYPDKTGGIRYGEDVYSMAEGS